MDNKRIINKLTNIVQLDIDAILAYNQAIENIEQDDIRQSLVAFRADHDRHVTDLSRVIERLGGTPPSFERDFKGFFIEGMTAITSKVGTRSALTSMFGNEMLTNSVYRAATEMEDVSDDIRNLVQRNYGDEQRHLAYIKNTLKEKFGMADVGVEREREARSADESRVP